ncbi:hypothetical protein GIB67_023233 [Kingdonia uniflora]|uniref:PRLI-interacting factor A n=1 Tax=Kingdonia uniflora TaxID=39325 RepID=A0A7J7L9F6_9MAGN|nr:hypothetical protein GIB67_023233 [Kingdonia uniflora]
MNDKSMMMNQQPQILNNNRPYGVGVGGGAWLSLAQPPEDPMKFQNQSWPGPVFTASNPNPRRNLWKPKKGARNNNNNIEMRRIGGANGSGSVTGGGYKPPTLHELQSQNRLKARRYFPKKKFNKNNNNNRFVPFAPRNTSSFIIRAKKSGGIAPLVSPCPVTPAVLTTPSFSPSKEDLIDTAEAEWGVDGYGSMNGLIRLRATENEDDDEEEHGSGSSDSDVEEHVEVERRLDHDLSRFEMIYPNDENENDHEQEVNMQVDRQDTHIAHLEEENLTLRERLFLMETEMVDLRNRLLRLERSREENNNEASGENDGADGCGDICSEKSVGDGEGDY